MKKDLVNPSNPFDRLHAILETVNIPEEEINNIRWLARNFDVIAPNHPKADEVHSLFRRLLFLTKE